MKAKISKRCSRCGATNYIESKDEIKQEIKEMPNLKITYHYINCLICGEKIILYDERKVN